MSLTMSLIMRLIVFLKSFETQAAPLPLLTRTATVHTNLGGDLDQPREGRWGCELCTHGVLGGRYAKRCRTAQGRARAGQHGEDRRQRCRAEPVVTLVKVTKSLRSASLTISLSCPYLRPKAMRVSVSAGRSGRERCVPAAQSRRMPERTLGLLYSLAKGGGWASAPRQLMRPRAQTLGACGRRGG